MICLVLLAITASCGNNKEDIKKLERIKAIGDNNPTLAIKMLDSVSINMQSTSKRIRMKCELLNIRLHDKAFIPATSDTKIMQIVDYFNSHGSNKEKQEALYYAGSVYRDLDDTPRALRYFLEAKTLCEPGNTYDTLMLRNTLSNLNCLYYQVQDYHNALNMAKEERTVAKQLNVLDATTILHEATSLFKLHKRQCAKAKFQEAFYTISHSKPQYYPQEIYSLLYHFSTLRMNTEADECYRLITEKGIKPDFADAKLTLSEYFIRKNNTDSATHYLLSVMNTPGNHEGKYDASKDLVRLYNRLGNKELAAHYAEIFIKECNTLNLGERQLKAATVNNKYKYYRNESRENELKEEKETFKNTTLIVALGAFVLIGLGYIIHVRKKNRQLKKIVRLSTEMKELSDSEEQLRREIAAKEEELEEYTNMLKEKEQRITEKMNQNKALIDMLHKSEIEEKADDIIRHVRQAALGKTSMTPSKWKQLYQAVDRLYPTYMDDIARELGDFNEHQMQIFYLIRIGLNKSQIRNLTGLSRATIWRWTSRLEEIKQPAN